MKSTKSHSRRRRPFGWRRRVSLAAARRTLFLLTAALLGTLPSMALAQCVMCGKNAEFAGDGEPGRAYATLAIAALVLLVPALSMIGGLAAYVWKHRH